MEKQRESFFITLCKQSARRGEFKVDEALKEFLNGAITALGIPSQELRVCVEKYSSGESLSSRCRLNDPFTRHLTAH